MVGQCNYGGRVTDNIDMRVLNALLFDFLGEHVLQVGYSAVKLPEDRHTFVSKDCEPYILPTGDNAHSTYIEKIKDMPSDEPPHLFGFHPNAEISKNIDQSQTLLNLMLKIGEIEGVTSLSNSQEAVKAITINLNKPEKATA
jgi:dynein heavy chain